MVQDIAIGAGSLGSIPGSIKSDAVFPTARHYSGPAPRGARPPNRHAWLPINKLALLKTAASVLNFKLWPPLITAWPPKSTALAPAQPLLQRFLQVVLPRCCGAMGPYSLHA